ncbi:MAG: RluA family pseudouridine synthase [Anaerolineae bacterium]|nr:RluA family pseudouridine synthase [Anaerolineae bacterium]
MSIISVLNFTPTSDEQGERLDKAITARLEAASRVKVQQLIKEGYAAVNGKVAKASYRLEDGDAVSVQLIDAIIAPDVSGEAKPESLPLDVLYDDDDVAVINKPAGMVVHPAAGHSGGTLVNAILARWSQIAFVGGEGRAGIVHRLDRDTSGVIVVAKTEAARLALMTQFAQRTVQKRYIALVEGIPNTLTGEINAPIARDPQHRKKMSVIKGGREAITHFRVLQTYQNHSLLECLPKTGRTHQIRVHLAFIDHPIVGDPVYGRRKQTIKLGRHFLHAESITFKQPTTHQEVTVSAPLPSELAEVLERL